MYLILHHLIDFKLAFKIYFDLLSMMLLQSQININIWLVLNLQAFFLSYHQVKINLKNKVVKPIGVYDLGYEFGGLSPDQPYLLPPPY
jgi:hypothetical protein